LKAVKKKGVRNIVKCYGEITVLTECITILTCDQTVRVVTVFTESMFRRINLISVNMSLVNMSYETQEIKSLLLGS
jgi:hypothetical protein